LELTSMEAIPVLVPDTISAATACALLVALDRAAMDPRPVLSLEGDAGRFCRGLDLAAAAEAAAPDGGLEAFARVLARVLSFPKPVLAVVDGPALGGGLGLAAAADVVLASERAQIALPEALFGLAPDLILPALERRLPPQKLALLLLTAHARSAREAAELGLFDEVVAPEALAGGRRAWVRALGRAHPASVSRLRAWTMADMGPRLARGAAETAATLADPAVQSRLRRFLDGEAPWTP